MSEQTISKEEFERFRFCARYWDANGGAPEKRPHWDEVDDGYRGKKQRVFVSATWFPTWEQFKPQADRARAAACVVHNPQRSNFVISGTSYPLDDQPRFLLEPLKWLNIGEYAIWINALCPDKEQFALTIAEAKRKVQQENAIATGGTVREMGVFEPRAEQPRYPTEWNQAGTDAASDLLLSLQLSPTNQIETVDGLCPCW